MDDDMDIDLGPLPEDDIIDVEPMTIEQRPQEDGEISQEEDLLPDNDVEPGEIQPEMASNKVYLRGLDNLATQDVRIFARDHYPSQDYSKIEWIDDTSANLIYPTDNTAAEALLSFSLTPETYANGADALLQLTQAKLLSTHPHTDLHVRLALTTDVKQARAHDASRFYLLNPDKDPRERGRRNDDRRSRRGQDRRGKRRRDDDEDTTPFDERMYDDDPQPLSSRIERPLQARRNSAANDGRLAKRPRATSNRSVDLFAGRLTRDEPDSRLRNRSASPNAIAEGDGRFGFSNGLEEPIQLRARGRRSFTPENSGADRPNARNGKDLFSATSRTRELFPGKSTPRNELPVNKGSRELFPTKSTDTPLSTSPNHRRTDAFDVADEGPELLVRSNGHNEPQINGTVEGRLKSRNLAERITNGPASSQVQSDGFNIRGAAPSNPGFSIRGAANLVNPRVKELFPDRRDVSNTGKELFSGGKRGTRRKAEDLFN
ncbi:MAG: hypothetical protein M1828_006604 [Chrysothrix sp. TS-e1954]|nr:MAG: hypothetical protein M1828_006604 [Chrysothrix sp. TS-e1954]